MKYSEFREYLILNKIPFQEDEKSLIVDDRIEISKIEDHKIVFLIDTIDFPYKFEMLKKAIELAETPLNERGEEKKYHLKHRYLGSEPCKYLNCREEDFEFNISINKESEYYKTKFTKAEIEELKEKFDTDFNDFEFIEVED